MGWERGYYYRVRKVNGRVVREYVGGGRIGALAAELDELNRQQREAEREARRRQREELAALESSLDRLAELAELAARAALLAAGYHQHKRGDWRKRRGRETSDG